ncbi:MAG: ABC transporter ATP-binding protein [Gordonia sp. (in: high G+C Gram-positive bacteria)]
MTELRVENLTVSFGAGSGVSTVVDDVNLAVGTGETVAIVGESGSGKSVTALSIMRLLPKRTAHVSGRVLLDDTDLLALPERAMQDVRGSEIAMIFQEPMTSLNPVLTVGHQLIEVIRRHQRISKAAAKTEAIALLDRVKIAAPERRVDDYPHEMSGGMLQRAMIAMALAGNPRILLADEPTTALDVTVQAQILDLLRELQAETDMGLLLITHDMGVVAEAADRTVVMFRSRELESGTTAQIFAEPAHAYTRALLSAVPRLGSMAGSAIPATFPLTDVDSGIVTPARTITTDPGGTVLDVRNLTTRFDIRSGPLRRVTARVHAVEDVSVSIDAHQTLSLVGESGSGKSTLGRSILRLVEPSAGSILLNGEDVRAMGPRRLQRERARMQMIFQDPFSSLNPRMTVGQAIAEPMLVHGIARRDDVADKVAELLRRVSLSPDVATCYPHEFSGGQRQRVSIARALSLNPDLIVADEAVSALDVTVKAQVVNLLLELQEQFGIAFLFISHDMSVVERLSHRVAVMYLGEIVEIGSRAQIFENPQHPYTRRLLDSVPVADPAIRRQRITREGFEPGSAVRPADYVHTPARYREHAPGHLVKES